MAASNDESQPAPPALGVFHSVHTRDAVAQTRNGWPYVEANPRGEDGHGEKLFEIKFPDGEWMLVVQSDLTPLPR